MVNPLSCNNYKNPEVDECPMKQGHEEKQLRQNFLHLKQILYFAFKGLVAVCLVVMAGCAGFTSVDQKFDGSSPVSGGGNIHVVQKKETLFSVAWRYGWDYKELASANSIRPPYIIHPGQKLKVGRSIAKTNNRSKKQGKTLTKPRVASSPATPSAYKSVPSAPKPVQTGQTPHWRWPSQGKVIAKFSSKSPVNKGIDIAGRLGESVHAAAAGSVVYAGSGLLGYGNLVIIKHNEQFLSAYAHNKKLLVKESQQVKAGQVIAEIGSSGTDQVKLHFEIRRQGKPVDPIRYLPKVRK